MPKSRVVNKNFIAGSSRKPRSAATLLLAMAKEAEELAAQADRIRELRERRHLTQPEVADAVGVSLRGYQLWEAGDSDPGPRNLKALAAFFEVSPEFISHGFERPSVPAPSLASTLGTECRLKRVETKLERIEALLTHLAGAEIVAAVEQELRRAAEPDDGADRSAAK